MMIFPKKLHRDTAPRTEASGHQQSAAEDGQRQLPDAWHVVLEDGSTSDRAWAGEGSTGAGGKLFEELAAALGTRAGAKGRPPRPRSVAMPSSPPQPLDALDDGLSPVGTPARSLAAYPGVATPVRSPSCPQTRVSDPSSAVHRSPSTAAADSSQQFPAERQSLLQGGFDVRLARVVDLWPRLPRGIQNAILAMIEVEAADAR